MSKFFVYEHLCALESKSAGRPGVASSLLNEGRAMLDALSTDLRRAGFDVLPAADDEEQSFRTLVAHADYCVIIAPEFDGILETRCRWVAEAGGRLIGPSLAAIRLTADKLELFHHFRKMGIRTPATWPLSHAPADLYPRVCKPRNGAGSQDAFLLNDAGDALAARDALAEASATQEMIAQEYAPGMSASVSFLIGPKQCVPLQPSRQRLSDDGRFRYLGGSLPLSREWAGRAIAIGREAVDAVPGLLGYIGVDVVLGADSDRDQVIEINPRFTTSYVGLRELADFNIAETMVQLFEGTAVVDGNWKEGTVEFAIAD